MNDRNYLIDLAHVIMQDAADEWHDKEALDGLEQEISEVDKEQMPALYAELRRQIEDAKEDWVEGAKCRRFAMDILATESPNYDYHKRCTVKHRATAYVQATEVFLANPNDLSYQLVVKQGKRFWKALAQLMGVEDIPNCGRCLSDQLNLEQAKHTAEEAGYELATLEQPQA